MSWKEDNAIKRIYNVFKRSKVYQEDVNALKLISNSIDEQDKSIANDNLLFAKLLSIQLRQNLEHYGSMEVALKKIDDELKRPLNYHSQILHTTFNHVEFDSYLKSIGININFVHSKADAKNNDDIIIKQQKEIAKKFIKDWSFEAVEKSFYKTANQIIKNINYYE
jgi:hypothetical protein